MMWKKVLLVFLILCSSISGKSQSHRFFSVNSGLASSKINNIVQDSDGYIWIGTEDGLNRFDGNRFVTYRNHPDDSTSLTNNCVKKIFEDSNLRLWICTMEGVCIYNKELDCFEQFSAKLNDKTILQGQINTVAEDKEGNIWISAANHGVVSINSEGEEFVHFTTGNSSLASNHINSILEDRNGRIWFGTENSLSSYDTATRQFHTHYIDGKTDFPKISSLCSDEDGNVWIGTLSEGVIIYDQNTETFSRLNDRATDSSNKEVCSILNDGYKMWVSIFDKGFKQYSAIDRNEISFELNVPEINVAEGTCHALFKDRQGNIWAGLYQKGLLLVLSDSQMFTNYQHNPFLPSSIADGAIVPVCCDSEGDIWLGKDGGGFYRLNKDKKIVSFYHDAEDKKKSIVVSMFEDSAKNIWIGTYLNGAMRFNRKTQSIDLQLTKGVDNRHLNSSHIVDIKETEDGRIWMATNGGGVNIYNPHDGTLEYLFKQDDHQPGNQLIDNWSNELLIDSDNMLWIGTYNGLCVYDIQQQRFVRYYTDELPEKAIFVLHEDLKGDIWVGTQGGLACIHKNSEAIDRFGLNDGLPNVSIQGILNDYAGNLWVTTGDGISMLNPDTQRFENYSTSEGMASSECNGNAFDVTPDGEFIIGTTEGFTSFFPENRSMQGSEPVNLMFTDLFIHNVKVGVSSDKHSVLKRTLNHSDHVTFNSRQNSFSIHFSAVEYSLPQNIHYELYLEGFDRKWQPANGNEATYTNLDSGNYTLHVRAWKNDRRKALQKDLKISVLPPIWASAWAKILYILIFAALVLVAYNHWKKEKDRKRQEEQLQDKLNFFTDISHEIRTPLTMIMTPLGKLISQNPNSSLLPTYNLMYKHANRLLFLVNQIIDLSSLTQRHLHVGKTDISRFVEDIINSFAILAEEKGLSMEFRSTPDTIEGYVDHDILSKILYNLISNAIKYTEQGKVRVEMSMEDGDRLSMKVSDTGCGIPENMQEKIFERFFMINNNPGKNRKISSGIGLHLTSRIVQLHHGTIMLDSKVGAGTVFDIILPVGKASYAPEEISGDSIIEGTSRIVVMGQHSSEDGTDEAGMTAKSSPTILIIEDEADIRKLLVKEFSREFSISEANNGKEGLIRCMEINPGLVICDILMPEMTGLDFCKKIRNNESFQNLPIIMLTARSSSSQQVEGIMAGADAYVTKPFDMDYLNAMVHRLLKRARTTAKPVAENVTAADNNSPSADEIMLKKINAIIDENIDNSEFDVDSFCRELAISRTHLNRKIRDLTGESPASYIKQARLRQAAVLLADKSLSISEVAYMTGFSSPSYFSQAFREYYGVSPKEFTI